MSLEQEVELIRRFPIFSKLPSAKQKLLCFSSERMTYAAGDVLFEEQSPGDSCYLIIEGTLHITVVLQNKVRRLIATMGPNEVCGEIAVFGQVKRTATATAHTKVEVLKISADLFRSIVRENPDAAMELIKILADRLANTTAQLSSLKLAAADGSSPAGQNP